MRTIGGDAPLEVPPQERIASLASLYDRFAHALDPDSPECEEAELAFHDEILSWYDNSLSPPRPPFREFRKAVIIRCRQHLLATAKPSSI